jgi:hypothetical protein
MTSFSWQEKLIDVDLLFENINSIRRVEGDRVSFEAFSKRYFDAMLFSALKPSSPLNSKVLEYCVKYAFSQINNGAVLKKEIFLDFCKTGLREYNNLPIVEYILVTSITSDIVLPFKSFTVRGCKITFNSMGGKSFRSKAIPARENLQMSSKNVVLKSDKLKPYYCYVKVKARKVPEAFESGIEALNIIRGIINLCINNGRGQTLNFGQAPEPFNTLRLGPLHTIHLSDGTIPMGLFWYEPHYSELNHFSKLKPTQNSSLKKKVTRTLKAVAKSQIKQEAETAILNYVNALDGSQIGQAFRDLWSTLEIATQASQLNNTDKSIERASNAFKNKKLAVQVLKHLRFRRNRMVHQLFTESDPDTLLLQLHEYLVPTLFRLLFNVSNAKTSDEFGQLLEVPQNSAHISAKLKILNDAKKYYSMKNLK